MNILNSKRNFLILIVIILFAFIYIFYYTFFNYQAYLSIEKDKKSLSYISILDKSLKNLNNEIIDSAIYMGSLGVKGGNTLKEHRIQTDSSLIEIKSFIDITKKKKLNKILKTLHKVRNQVDTLSDDTLNVFHHFYYNNVIQPLVDMDNTIIEFTYNNDNKNLARILQKYNMLDQHLTLENSIIIFSLSNNKPLSIESIKLWDNLIKEDRLPTLKQIEDLQLKQKLSSFIVKSIYRKIGKEERINIFYHVFSGEYDITIQSWLMQSRQKKMYLAKVKNIILEHMLNDISKHMIESKNKIFNNFLWIIILIIMLTIILIARFSLKKNKKIVENALHHVEVEKAATKAKDQFLANMSHEIRTPLNGIIGFTQLLKKTPVNQEQEEFISIIETSSESLLSIINDILDISKINAEKMEIEEISFNLNEKIESVIEILSAKAEAKNIVLSLYIDPSISPYRVGDPTRLAQVIMNLIGNAIKFTPEFGQISCIIQAADENKLMFKVQDTGIGISQENQTKIFKAFSQADTSTVRKFGGTGLGLTISSMIVKLMDGKLELQSTKGKGSTFFFTIPLQKDHKQYNSTLNSFSGTKVSFVVFDKTKLQDNHLFMQSYLEKLGCEFSFINYNELTLITAKTQFPHIFIFNHFELIQNKDKTLGQTINSSKINTVLITNNTLKKELASNMFTFNSILTFSFNLDKIVRILNENIQQTISNNQTDFLNKEIKFENLKILVAEDDIINQKLIKTVLTNLNIDVTITSNGIDAYEAYMNHSFNLIFTDIIMPKMNGLELAKKVREYEKEHILPLIPIVALTGQKLHAIKKEYLEAGINDYMLKPLSLKELKRLLVEYFSDYIRDC